MIKGIVDFQKLSFEDAQIKLNNNSLQNLAELILNKKLSEKWDIPVELNGNLSWNKNKKSREESYTYLAKIEHEADEDNQKNFLKKLILWGALAVVILVLLVIIINNVA